MYFHFHKMVLQKISEFFRTWVQKRRHPKLRMPAEGKIASYFPIWALYFASSSWLAMMKWPGSISVQTGLSVS